MSDFAARAADRRPLTVDQTWRALYAACSYRLDLPILLASLPIASPTHTKSGLTVTSDYE